jgi:hypothetical protein
MNTIFFLFLFALSGSVRKGAKSAIRGLILQFALFFRQISYNKNKVQDKENNTSACAEHKVGISLIGSWA